MVELPEHNYESLFDPGPGAVSFEDFRPSAEHSTVQAVWVLYMLKHRYPEWVDQNYRSN